MARAAASAAASTDWMPCRNGPVSTRHTSSPRMPTPANRRTQDRGDRVRAGAGRASTAVEALGNADPPPSRRVPLEYPITRDHGSKPPAVHLRDQPLHRDV